MTAVGADALWAPLVDHGTQWCAPNVDAKATWLDAGDARWRLSVTTPGPRNSYVVSATGQYLEYAQEEVRRLPGAVERGASRASLAALSPLLRRMDPIVVLDALPVSTVLHPIRSREAWAAALHVVREQYAGLPIVIRSLDRVAAPLTLDHLTALGMRLMPSRLVFHQDPRAAEFWRIRNVRHDCDLAAREPMESRTLTIDDSDVIAALYWQLYGDKHSTLNPRFTSAWLAHGMASGVLRGEGLVHDGRLAAAYLSYSVEDMMTNPVFGYDTALPQALGLYRRLSVLTMQAARTNGHRLHASSGAPGFKASRGGVATLEYHALDLHTVRGASRVAWEAAYRIASGLGTTMLRRAM